MKAILLSRTGDPSVLEYVELPTPRPGEGEVLVRADTIGVCMPEMLVRRGTYAWMPRLPAIPGIEMSGRIVECGAGVTERAVGDKVFVSARDLAERAGCYAEYIAVPERAAHPLPPGCDLEAAACLSNYQVAYHLLYTASAPTLPSPAGGGGLGSGASRGVEAKTVLVHTAAGGVGSAAVQLARIAGMRVIGVAGSAAKTRAVLALGAGHAINYRGEDVVARVREATAGRGADLILDPVGGKGFARNFAMLAPLGLVVSYGRLDGPPDPAFVAAMREHGAVSPAVRFFTIHSFDDRPDIRAAATGALIDWLARGEIRPLIHARLPLAEAARAHEMLEAGEVIGKIVMKP
jgi:NADPH2:quinone reductase